MKFLNVTTNIEIVIENNNKFIHYFYIFILLIHAIFNMIVID
jgi:hypothetical protein